MLLQFFKGPYANNPYEWWEVGKDGDGGENLISTDIHSHSVYSICCYPSVTKHETFFQI